MLASLADEALLRAACRDGRAIVTENARDFDRIVRAWAVAGEHHCGVVFTSTRRYHRGSRSYPQNLVEALRLALEVPPMADLDWVLWLASRIRARQTRTRPRLVGHRRPSKEGLR